MKIGIVSDSHGDIKELSKVYNFLHDSNVDTLAHLGDDSFDMNKIKNGKLSHFGVPGTREKDYCDLDKRCICIKENNLLLSFSHVKSDHYPNADIIIYGHTHVPDISFVFDKLFVNPGHVIKNKHRHPISTFAILELLKTKVKVSLFSTNFEKLEEKEFLF